MSKLYDIIQDHIDRQPYPPSARQVAGALGVAPTTMNNWRKPKELVSREHLLAIAELTRVPYVTVLDALLHDIGYLPAPGSRAVRDRDQAALLAGEEPSERPTKTTRSDQSEGRTTEAG